jgi:hypothetical protein
MQLAARRGTDPATGPLPLEVLLPGGGQGLPQLAQLDPHRGDLLLRGVNRGRCKGPIQGQALRPRGPCASRLPQRRRDCQLVWTGLDYTNQPAGTTWRGHLRQAVAPNHHQELVPGLVRGALN